MCASELLISAEASRCEAMGNYEEDGRAKTRRVADFPDVRSPFLPTYRCLQDADMVPLRLCFCLFLTSPLLFFTVTRLEPVLSAIL